MAKQKKSTLSPENGGPGSEGLIDKHPITHVPHTDSSRLLNPTSEKRQSMQGFDDEFVDIVDYIVRITHKIWEEKGIGRIYDYYAHNILIHTMAGQTYGRDKVIAASLQTMSAFSDIRLHADDVIWSGNDQDGFHSSHRIIWIGRNTGHSIYGPPTGRKVMRQGIAHCFVKENYIVEEWICRDELALIRQLGFDEHALAKKMAEQAASSGVSRLEIPGEVERLKGQLPPATLPRRSVDSFDIEDFVQRSIHEIWNWRLLNKIDDYYSPNYVCHTSTNRQLYGLGEFKAYVLGLLATFPDASVTVDHICWLGNESDGYRVATRWTLLGTHAGPGIYGPPTGKRIQMMGITHQHLKKDKFVQEWTAFDEFALLKQIYWPD